MPPLSWNEIKDRALAFSKEWADETSENAEAKTFWDEFFNIFGIKRRRIASFEKPIKKSDGKGGFIDLLWKGTLLVEHKSKGKNLDRAFHQATDYFPGLKERDLPRYIVVSDFSKFRIYDLEEDTLTEFLLAYLYKNIRLFGFIAGYHTHELKPEDPANIKAAELMGKLHDQLKEIGYDGHQLEIYLVRLLFCLFAEDTSIFEKGQFQEYIDIKTSEDGSDLAYHITAIFHTLNKSPKKRLKNLDEHLNAFPHVNGKLFEEQIPPASFDSKMRNILLDCCALDWSRISPAIFGSLFQSVMDKKLRRNLGAHYTTEQNILKVINPLFLDDLRLEFEKIKRSKPKLKEFQDRLAKMKFFDPACGCGNFLVIAYRELRLLELDVLSILYGKRQHGFLDVTGLVMLDVDQFYGIEIKEFPAQIAQVALWMTDHQMNMRLSEKFGKYFRRLPLKKAPSIVCGNALEIDWESIVPINELSFIIGNPPFVGKYLQTSRQKAEVRSIFHDIPRAGILDYVTCWYKKSVDLMDRNKKIKTAFVSTNSITQGEQPEVLWVNLFNRGLKIHFAHRTFKWSSEAKGKAAVYCVIIGFALYDTNKKHLWDYETPKSEPHIINTKSINSYLVDAPNVFLSNIRKSICDVPKIVFGSMPNDGGHLFISKEEREKLGQQNPKALRFIKQFLGASEFINGKLRYCLWLKDINPAEYRKTPEIMQKIEGVKQHRLASKRKETRNLALSPSLFAEIRQPDSEYILIPRHTSENRQYIPFGFFNSDHIVGDSCFAIPNATLFHFGILSSEMHMAWVRLVCGRLKGDYRYSAGIVYNNYPWPEPTKKQKQAIETAAQNVLDARNQYPESSLADLYDPLIMPYKLLKAHQKLDKAVDASYRRKVFKSEVMRVAFLFEQYEKIIKPLIPKELAEKRNKQARKRKTGKKQ